MVGKQVVVVKLELVSQSFEDVVPGLKLKIFETLHAAVAAEIWGISPLDPSSPRNQAKCLSDTGSVPLSTFWALLHDWTMQAVLWYQP